MLCHYLYYIYTGFLMNPVVFCGVLSVFYELPSRNENLELFEVEKMFELSGT